MKSGLNAQYSQTTGSVIDTYSPGMQKFEMPETYGVGLNYIYDKKLTIGADYSMQKWCDALFMSKTDSLVNRSRLAIGAEYLPNARSRKYSQRVTYRAGFNISDPYYKVNGVVQPKNFGVSFGFGLPMKNNKSVLNATFEYGKIGSSTLLRENYLKFTLNAVVNENWFFKRKL
jgi:hypothetical protein